TLLREVPAGEQIPLSLLAALVGEDVALGDVAHVDDVDRSVQVARDAAKQETAHQGIGGSARVRVLGAQDERRVHDHHGQALGGGAHRYQLGLVLGVDVGDPETTHGERVILVDGLTRPRGPYRARARGEHGANDAGTQRLL